MQQDVIIGAWHVRLRADGDGLYMGLRVPAAFRAPETVGDRDFAWRTYARDANGNVSIAITAADITRELIEQHFPEVIAGVTREEQEARDAAAAAAALDFGDALADEWTASIASSSSRASVAERDCADFCAE